MLSTETFHKLKIHGTSSWAVWDENKNDVDFFLSKLNILHGKAVFVGLNRSNIANDLSKIAPLSNFHTKCHIGDKRLKRFIQDAQLLNLIGSFMTDISEQIETNSNLVRVNEQNAVKVLAEKVRSIDNFQIRHIICFGDKVFNTLVNAFRISKNQIVEVSGIKIREVEIKGRNETWHLYRVWHYSNYGIFIHKSEIELPIQLKYINDKIEAE